MPAGTIPLAILMGGLGMAASALGRRFQQQPQPGSGIQALAQAAQQLGLGGPLPQTQPGTGGMGAPSRVMPPPTTVPQQGGGTATRRGGLKALPTGTPATPSQQGPLTQMQQRRQQPQGIQQRRMGQPQRGVQQQFQQRGQQPQMPQQQQGGLQTSGPPALVTPDFLDSLGFVPLGQVMQGVNSINLSTNANDPNSLRVALNQGDVEILSPFEVTTPAGIPVIITPGANRRGDRVALSIHMEPDFARVAGLVSRFTGHPITSPLVALETNQILTLAGSEGGAELVKAALAEIAQTGGFAMTQRAQARLQQQQPQQQFPQAQPQQPSQLGVPRPPTAETQAMADEIAEEQGGPSFEERMAQRQPPHPTQARGEEPETVADLIAQEPSAKEVSQERSMAGFLERQRARKRQERIDRIVDDTQINLLEKDIPIINAQGRAIVDLGHAIDALTELGPLAGQDSEFSAALRLTMTKIPFFQTALESFGGWIESIQTGEWANNVIPADSPINIAKVKSFLGRPLSNAEIKYISAMNSLLTDIRGFTGEARPTDYDTARVVRALGMQFFTTPRLAMANIATLQDKIIRAYRSEVERIQRVAPALLKQLNPNTPLQPYELPDEWKRAAREIQIRPSAQEMEKQRGRRSQGRIHPGSTITEENLSAGKDIIETD